MLSPYKSENRRDVYRREILKKESEIISSLRKGQHRFSTKRIEFYRECRDIGFQTRELGFLDKKAMMPSLNGQIGKSTSLSVFPIVLVYVTSFYKELNGHCERAQHCL